MMMIKTAQPNPCMFLLPSQEALVVEDLTQFPCFARHKQA